MIQYKNNMTITLTNFITYNELRRTSAEQIMCTAATVNRASDVNSSAQNTLCLKKTSTTSLGNISVKNRPISIISDAHKILTFSTSPKNYLHYLAKHKHFTALNR